MILYIDGRNGTTTDTAPEGLPIALEVSIPLPNSINLVLAMLQSYRDLPASPIAIKVVIGS